ncbi:hypothetical protein XA68_17624 [Ophiocordyceps unilateralis]|uniref:Pumilio homology domain family member 3 n=1 Tax=Ophiocordyceps unilateralis TaxID=268505 RepID=A0A2A9P3N1_OPHUN|nr:hypothetical protein XA68_17624 [Ophiocordyceps unilateralis]
MAAATRSRGFPNLTMPPGSGDKAQQPMGSAFPGSNLYPNKSIWTSTSSFPSKPIGSKESDGSPSGSSALNANSEADPWSSSSHNPWNTDLPGRSVSTSPSRPRDGTNSGYFDHQPSAIGMNKGRPFHDDYAASFSAQGRSDAYMDAFSHHRDASLPPSRHSQASPTYHDIYRTSHTPSNSMSQRPLPNTSFSSQSVNQRAFNLNKQLDDDLSVQFGRRMALDSPSYGQPAQPFQFNPGSQPWVGDGRFGSSMDMPPDPMTAQYAALKRSPVDRVSPGPSYRLESGNGSRAYSSDSWAAKPPSRDARPADFDRRAPAGPPSLNNYHPSFFPGQYPYGGMPTQYPAGFLDPYNQNFRHHPMMASYGLHAVHGGYPLGANLPPVRPSRDQDSGKGMRSALLDEFRISNKSSKRYELKDIYNHVVEFSGDQHGSRFIQQKLESANSDEKEQVFREIEPNAIQLMKDVFGNYVVQKFFEHGNQVQKRVLAEKMKGKVVDLSVQVYACRVVQKALEHVLVEQQAELTKELEPEILRVTRDQNGNHVVQKIIELVPRQYIDFIVGALRGQVTGLASHMYGCRVIQRMLEHGTDADKQDIMVELHASAQILITDQYGNYVAQHVIQNGKPEDRQRMIELVMAQLLTLSKHKFASNVVEKCIEYGTAEQRTNIRQQFTAPGGDGVSPLQQMIRDQYGNYVIQKLLGQLSGAERDTLVEDIKPQFYSLKKNGATRQLQALEKLLGLGSKGEATPSHADASSASATPVLTNETNSPQSSSPPSTHVSAVGFPSSVMGKETRATAPKVQDDTV